MAKRIATLAVATVLLVAWIVVPAFSKGKYEHHERAAAKLTDKVTKYSFPQIRFKPVAKGDIASPADDNAADNPYHRSSLGTALSPSGVASPGFAVIESYNDDQMFPGGNRQVDFRGSTPSVHFAYGSAKSTTQPGKFGYNVYDPVGGVWPRGAGVGCEIQAADAEGWWNNMDVGPQGYIVISGNDDASGSLDNHFFWQTMTHGCFWGTGSQILPSQYNVNFLDPSNYLTQVRIEVQEYAGDTIIHCIAVESNSTTIQGDLQENSLNYFRKVGWTQSGAWTGPITLDSMNRSSSSQQVSNGGISASRISGKVLVAYTHFHEMAFVYNQRYDCEVFFRTSDDAGLTWGPINNLTSANRDVDANGAYIECVTLIDSEDGLHVIWTGETIPGGSYDNPAYFWGDFSAGLYHWTDRVAGPNAGGTMTRAWNAEWGIAWNTQVCGFPSPGSSYLGYESISECDGRLYLTCSQWLDAWGIWGVPQINDCASGFSNRLYAANGEVGMVVSSSLDGILWDAPRNLTKTYTPGCDSAGYGGVCMNDSRATAARFGMDSAAYGVPLIWPGGELVMPDNSEGWDGSKYIHVFYTEDHYPAPGWRSTMGDAPADYNMVTLNPLRWMRVPCVAPIPAAQIFLSHESFGWPQWVKHTEQFVQTINITNDGNVTLNVDSIVLTETDPVAGWLQASEASVIVPAGVDNMRTFDMTIDGTVIGAPGTAVALNGDLTLYSNAANRPNLTIPIINFMVCDTIIPIEYDTISTGIVFLALGSAGEMGFGGGGGGAGTVNLDYVTAGGECNPSIANPATNIYLFSGGPEIIINHGDGTFETGHGMQSQGFTLDIDNRRIHTGADDAHIDGSNFDGYFTGTCVSPDTTIAFERTYYAPTGGGDSTDFVIIKTDYWSWYDTTVDNVTIGEMYDWDTPAEGVAGANTAGAVGAYSALYQQGVDTSTVPQCQLNADRFSANAFLGMHWAADTAGGENCAGTCEPYGSYTMRNDSLFAMQAVALNDPDNYGAWFWEKMGAYTGVNVLYGDEEIDLHSVMTELYDVTFLPGEVLTTFTVATTVHEGTVNDLKDNLDAAFQWYSDNLRPGCTSLCGCCVGLTGNVDNDPEDITDIGDLTKLIDFLFISYTPPVCMEEANCDGSSDGVVDVGDLTKLIDFLFISYTPVAPC